MKKKPYTPHLLKAVMATLFALLFGVQNVQAQEAYAVLNGGTLTFYYDTSRSTRTGTTYDLNAGPAAPDWYSSRLSVTNVEFNSSFGNARPTTTARWFDGMTNLTSVRGTYYLNTSETTDMQLMFHDCSSLTSVAVSDFKTDKVTNMQLMFSGCSSLKTLNLSGWNVSNVTIMYQMFTDCSSLTSVNVLGWNTSNVTDMSFMFQGCSSLTALDLSSWTTPQVIYMSYMFRYCTNLATIYIGKNWGINANVYDAEMFVGCTSLVGASGTQHTLEPMPSLTKRRTRSHSTMTASAMRRRVRCTICQWLMKFQDIMPVLLQRLCSMLRLPTHVPHLPRIGSLVVLP